MNIMRKIFLTVLLVAFASAAFAEGTPKKPSVAGFVSNGFWDNWEVSAGFGTGTAFSNGDNYGPCGDRFGFEGNLSVTKWVHPVFGMRAQLQGGWFNNFDSQIGKMTWPYMFGHMDFMVNASNWIGGYRADRAWYAVPFVGFGYMASNFTDRSQRENASGSPSGARLHRGSAQQVPPVAGLRFQHRTQGSARQVGYVPCGDERFLSARVSATAGSTYRFNKRGWERGVPGYTAADIQAFQDAVAASISQRPPVGECARSAQQLEDAGPRPTPLKPLPAAAAAKAAAAPQPLPRNVNTLSPSSIVFYDYGMSKLTSKDKTRLELMADVIKDGPKDRVYTIVGHADQQTGTAAGNHRVAENRAKNVYDYLVKCGVNPKQLTYEGKGQRAGTSTESNQKANRAVIVK